MESQVPEVSRVCSARREMKGREVSQDLQAQLGCRCAPQYHLKYFEQSNREQTKFNRHLILQGLPGPPGEKGETGDVGQMVRWALRL